MVADHRLLTHELGKHGGSPLFYGILNVLISFHLVLFSPKVIIHSFTAALYSHISFAVLFESTHTQTLLLDYCRHENYPHRTARADNATQIQSAAANEQKLAFAHANC